MIGNNIFKKCCGIHLLSIVIVNKLVRNVVEDTVTCESETMGRRETRKMSFVIELIVFNSAYTCKKNIGGSCK